MFEFFYSIYFAMFAITGTFFWFTIAGSCAFIIWLLDDINTPFTPFTFVIGILGAAIIFANPPLLAMIKNDPSSLAIMLGVYLLIGTVWSGVKWYFELQSLMRRYTELKQKFSEREKGFILKDFIEHVRRNDYDLYMAMFGGNDTVQVPQARNYKSAIMRWIAAWPLSMIWTLINDPFKRLVEEIYRNITGLFQRISNSMFKSVMNDLNNSK